MQIGFVTATLMMLALTTLTPEVSYAYEALIMVFMGMGMGVAMPTLNLAIQNEFAQKELGVATSSSQLFRSLGSTLGTAIFGAVLTAGIVSHLGDIQATPYVQQISSNAQVARIGDIKEANTILTLNTPSIKSEITTGAEKSFQALPVAKADAARTQFLQSQSDFSSAVTHAFSNSLKSIFTVASILMAIATVLIFLLKERPLKAAKPTDMPGDL